MNECKNCQEPTANPKFCNRSCSATFNNKGRRRRGEAPGFCTYCSKPKGRAAYKYCSNQCQRDLELEQSIASGIFSAKVGRNWLLKEGHQCSVCQRSEWNDQPIPIELDHIDGDSTNNQLINLRLICPNCHAQTPTYKSKNRGNGRHSRRERYARGQSY